MARWDEGIWFVEYSPTQRAFHLNTAAETAFENRRALMEGSVIDNDYAVLAVAKSRAEASELVEQLRQQLNVLHA